MSTGIDIPIDALVNLLDSSLWISNSKQMLGRVYRNEIPGNSGIQPLYYSGGEAIDVLKNDNYDAQCFVDVMPERNMYADAIEANVRLMFMVDLLTLYPSYSRSESIEQVMGDVVNVLMSSQVEVVKMVSGYESFSDYKWKEDALTDLQNHHLFRFDLKLIYQNT